LIANATGIEFVFSSWAAATQRTANSGFAVALDSAIAS